MYFEIFFYQCVAFFNTFLKVSFKEQKFLILTNIFIDM